MAKVIITIEDLDDGGVRCVSQPNVAQLVKIRQRDAGLTSAETYAVVALNAIHAKGKQADKASARGRIVTLDQDRTT